jgi:hypothetical protein
MSPFYRRWNVLPKPSRVRSILSISIEVSFAAKAHERWREAWLPSAASSWPNWLAGAWPSRPSPGRLDPSWPSERSGRSSIDRACLPPRSSGATGRGGLWRMRTAQLAGPCAPRLFFFFFSFCLFSFDSLSRWGYKIGPLAKLFTDYI